MNGKTYSLQDYLQRQNVSGMLVLKDGKIAWKYLGEGNTDATLWTSRSVEQIRGRHAGGGGD